MASTDTRVSYFVKNTSQWDRSEDNTEPEVPSERHWALSHLTKAPGVQISPRFFYNKTPSITSRVVDRFVRRFRAEQPSVFWSKYSPDLASELIESQDNFDVALSVNNTATATLLVLRKQRLLRRPVVCMLIGVADWMETATEQAREETIGYLASADRLLVLGKAESEYLSNQGLDNIEFLPFGIDTSYWSPSGEPAEDYVLAVGSDPKRDFDTLIRACPFPLKIMTHRPVETNGRHSSNISFPQGNTTFLKALYDHARLVVVPLKNSLQPSGKTTILQAMSMGKPVIITQTRGTWTDKFQSNDNCVYVKPEDVSDMERSLRALYNDPSAIATIGQRGQATVRAYYSVEHLTQGLVSAAKDAAVGMRD